MSKLNFLEAGSGTPVVFLHGFCESGTIWLDLMNNLSDEFRVLCPDLPGFGKSEALSGSFSLSHVGDEVVHWLQKLGIHRTVIIGHSLGGYIALEMFRNHQKSIAAIGLFNSSAFADAQDKKENRDKLIQFLGQHGVEPFIKTFVPSLFYPPTLSKYQHIVNQISSDGLLLDPGTVAGYTAAMRDRDDSLDLLQNFSDRILLIAGEYDQNVPLERSMQMAQLLKSENILIVPESAHMSLFEQPSMCYTAIRKFLKSIPV